ATRSRAVDAATRSRAADAATRSRATDATARSRTRNSSSGLKIVTRGADVPAVEVAPVVAAMHVGLNVMAKIYVLRSVPSNRAGRTLETEHRLLPLQERSAVAMGIDRRAKWLVRSVPPRRWVNGVSQHIERRIFALV